MRNDELTTSEIASLRKLLGQLSRDAWAGPVLNGGLPQVPQRTALPTASKDYDGLLCYIAHTTGVKGRVYLCRLAADNTTWEWVALDN